MPETTQSAPETSHDAGPEYGDQQQHHSEHADPLFEGHNINVGSNERLMSVAAGSLLAMAGFRRRSFFGLGLMVIGASLIRRGATGYCPVTAALAHAHDHEEGSEHAMSEHASS